jgi:hypothetical protein
MRAWAKMLDMKSDECEARCYIHIRIKVSCVELGRIA